MSSMCRVAKSVARFPVVHSEDDAIEIARSIGAEVDFWGFRYLLGAHIKIGGVSYIVVKKGLRGAMAARAILHEVAHAVMHQKGFLSYLPRGSIDLTWQEKEAELFAFLLMGKELRDQIKWDFWRRGKDATCPCFCGSCCGVCKRNGPCLG